MRTFVALAFMLLAALPAAAGGPVRPVFHEETASVWDQLSHEFEDFGAKFREHFGGRFPMGREGRGESRGERPMISYMLSHREELRLSPEQVRKLEGIRSDFERDARKTEDELRRAERDLDDQLKADSVDLKQAETKVREVERLRAEQRIGRIRAIEQGRSILSQEQRERLRDMQNSGSRFSRGFDALRERRPDAQRERRSDSERRDQGQGEKF